MNIDSIIPTYDIRTDPILQEYWVPVKKNLWKRIETYGEGVNDYGKNTLSPHLTRIATDSRDFLLYLGQPEHVAHNFYDAIKISDIGKTHEQFDINIWKLPKKPTDKQRLEKRQHTQRGLEVLDEALKEAPQNLLDHPHIKTIIPVHIEAHHTPLSQNQDMGTMMEIACLVDAYDGDMDKDKITHGDGKVRTNEDQKQRMLAPSPNDKYHGYFRKELVLQYFEFRETHRS